MTAIIHVPYQHDVYIVAVRDNKIIRIEKLLGDIHLREVAYDDLSPELRYTINDYITNHV